MPHRRLTYEEESRKREKTSKRKLARHHLRERQTEWKDRGTEEAELTGFLTAA